MGLIPWRMDRFRIPSVRKFSSVLTEFYFRTYGKSGASVRNFLPSGAGLAHPANGKK